MGNEGARTLRLSCLAARFPPGFSQGTVGSLTNDDGLVVFPLQYIRDESSVVLSDVASCFSIFVAFNHRTCVGRFWGIYAVLFNFYSGMRMNVVVVGWEWMCFILRGCLHFVSWILSSSILSVWWILQDCSPAEPPNRQIIFHLTWVTVHSSLPVCRWTGVILLRLGSFVNFFFSSMNGNKIEEVDFYDKSRAQYSFAMTVRRWQMTSNLVTLGILWSALA